MISLPAVPHAIDTIRDYWNTHLHDLVMTDHPVGTPGFFQTLDAYRLEKLDYLPKVVDFTAYRDQRLLEIGCGIGLDAARFARHGASVTGVDLAAEPIRLAQAYFAQQALQGDFQMMNGEALLLPDATFDVVYVHGVPQYTCDAARMIAEVHRVLKPGGEAILMVYNRYAWLTLMSVLFRVPLEHADAPYFRLYTASAFRHLLRDFSQVAIHPERFPVPTRLHRGLKAMLYNTIFVRTFNMLPKAWVRPFGWHLMARAIR